MKHRQEKLRNNNMKKYYFLYLFPGQLITFQSFRPKNCIHNEIKFFLLNIFLSRKYQIVKCLAQPSVILPYLIEDSGFTTVYSVYRNSLLLLYFLFNVHH